MIKTDRKLTIIWQYISKVKPKLNSSVPMLKLDFIRIRYNPVKVKGTKINAQDSPISAREKSLNKITDENLNKTVKIKDFEVDLVIIFALIYAKIKPKNCSSVR